jgi:hypothetical protein
MIIYLDGYVRMICAPYLCFISSVGLARFANFQRSAHVDQMFIDMNDDGIRIKIDTIGNIWAKNMADDDGPMIYVKPLNRTNSNERFVIDQRNVKVIVSIHIW